MRWDVTARELFGCEGWSLGIPLWKGGETVSEKINRCGSVVPERRSAAGASRQGHPQSAGDAGENSEEV